MSAFICNGSHITALAVYAAKNRIGGHTDAKAIGDILHAQNVRSVNYIYDKTIRPSFELCEWASFHPFSRAQIVVAAECLSYQSCEHPGWGKSEACEIVDAIIGGARPDDLPGYDDAQWEISPPNLNAYTRALDASAAQAQRQGQGLPRTGCGDKPRSPKR